MNLQVPYMHVGYIHMIITVACPAAIPTWWCIYLYSDNNSKTVKTIISIQVNPSSLHKDKCV